MRQRLTVFLTILITLSLVVSTAFANAPRVKPNSKAKDELPYAPGRLLVKLTQDAVEYSEISNRESKHFSSGLASLDALNRSAGATEMYHPYIKVKNFAQEQDLGIDRWYMVKVSSSMDMIQLAKRYENDPNVEHATPDWRAYPAQVPNDPIYASQWGHNNTGQMLDYCWSCGGHPAGSPVGTVGFDANAQSAWDNSQGFGSSSIVIGIIDSGVDIDHPDLLLVPGYDYGSNDSNPDDNSGDPGHGTACAGVAAARANNALGVAGIAGGCSVMPLKVANNAGQMFFSSIQNALYHAADNGADIASMSLGAAITSDPATNTALQYAYNAGVTILAATGNENASQISYPAINQYVIAVGAASPCGDRKRSSSNSSELNPGVNADPNGYTCDGERWWGSSYGSNTPDAASAVDIIAPTIMPTTDIGGSGGYDPSDYSLWFNGTSCATPYAAGVAALILSQNPGWTPAQVRQQLVSTASDIQNVESGAGWDRYSGYGMVDAAAATAGGSSNNPPSANANGTYSGTAGTAISFSSAGSSDSDGSIVSYQWSFGDGNSSTQANPSHTYAAAGSYNVSLTVTDDGGAQDTDFTTASVANPPATYASLPYSTGFESGNVDQYWRTYSSNGFGRVQVTSANSPYAGSYHLTMDVTTNGNFAQNESWLHLNLSGQSQVTLDFQWKDFSDENHSQDGVYLSDNAGNSFVKVQDLNGQSYTNNSWNSFSLDIDQLASSNGLSLSSTFVIKFQQYDNYVITTDGHAYDAISVTGGGSNTPPTAEANGPYSATTGQAISFSSAGSNDPDGSISSYLWDFGDGNSSTAANPSHTYAAAGSYNVNLTVTDNGGAQDSDGAVATVTNPANNPPTANANGPYSGTVGNAIAFSSAGSNDSDGSISSYLWDFDDGNTSTQANPSHTYTAAGTYNVTLTVTDNDGADDSDVATATVSSGGGGSWVTITYDDFESGWGSYVDGGSDCRRSANDNQYAHQGTYCARIRDNTSTSNFTHGSTYDATGYDQIRVSFWYYPRSMDNSNEDFWVQFYDGSSWQTIATYARNIDFQNNNFYEEPGVVITSSQYNFPNNMRIRFVCDASGNSDWVYIDEVHVEGHTVSSSASMGGGMSLLAIPDAYDLGQNYPNPFNPTTQIRYALPEQSDVSIKIYDISGRLVKTLVNTNQAAGNYTRVWNGRNENGLKVSSGIYIYHMVAGSFVQTKRMVLLK